MILSTCSENGTNCLRCRVGEERASIGSGAGFLCAGLRCSGGEIRLIGLIGSINSQSVELERAEGCGGGAAGLLCVGFRRVERRSGFPLPMSDNINNTKKLVCL
jgi:hypothetical protein